MNKIPAVEKTIALLELLGRLPNGATQAELKAELGISMSTTYRILQTLQQHKWIKKNPDASYELGSGLLPLLHKFRDRLDMLESAGLVLERIAREHAIACKLSIRRGAEQVTIFRAEPDGPVALTGQVGSSFPVFEGSVGAALLCRESDEAILALIEESPTELPEREDPSLVLAAVAEVREQGYVLNLRKNRWNIAAMSMPIINADGSVMAALTLIGTESDFTVRKRSKQVEILKRAVRDCHAGGDICPIKTSEKRGKNE